MVHGTSTDNNGTNGTCSHSIFNNYLI
jgi:hypothetical protein